MGSVNHGFMGSANAHFNPNGTNHLNQLTSPSAYHRPNVQAGQRSTQSSTRTHANTYHSQAWHFSEAGIIQFTQVAAGEIVTVVVAMVVEDNGSLLIATICNL